MICGGGKKLPQIDEVVEMGLFGALREVGVTVRDRAAEGKRDGKGRCGSDRGKHLLGITEGRGRKKRKRNDSLIGERKLSKAHDLIFHFIFPF